MNNKIAGLYVNLAKALNALEEAGEDPRGYDGLGLMISGDTGGVEWTPEGFVVVQA